MKNYFQASASSQTEFGWNPSLTSLSALFPSADSLRPPVSHILDLDDLPDEPTAKDLVTPDPEGLRVNGMLAFSNTEKERQVIIHFQVSSYYHDWADSSSLSNIRLVPEGDSTRPSRVCLPNFGLHTFQKPLEFGKRHQFTLIFEGLPKGCHSFGIEGICAGDSPVSFWGIKRNLTDVYHIVFK